MEKAVNDRERFLLMRFFADVRENMRAALSLKDPQKQDALLDASLPRFPLSDAEVRQQIAMACFEEGQVALRGAYYTLEPFSDMLLISDKFFSPKHLLALNPSVRIDTLAHLCLRQASGAPFDYSYFFDHPEVNKDGREGFWRLFLLENRSAKEMIFGDEKAASFWKRTFASFLLGDNFRNANRLRFVSHEAASKFLRYAFAHREHTRGQAFFLAREGPAEASAARNLVAKKERITSPEDLPLLIRLSILQKEIPPWDMSRILGHEMMGGAWYEQASVGEFLGRLVHTLRLLHVAAGGPEVPRWFLAATLIDEPDPVLPEPAPYKMGPKTRAAPRPTQDRKDNATLLAAIEDAMRQTGGNMFKAASIVGMANSSMRYFVSKNVPDINAWREQFRVQER